MSQYNYKIEERQLDLIEELVKINRYDTKEEFVSQALEVFLTWENDPQLILNEMTKIKKGPTVEQYGFMVFTGMDLIHLKKTYPKYPEKFNTSWETYLSKNPHVEEKWHEITAQHDQQSDERASHKDYEQSIARKTDAENFVKTLNFSEKIECDNEYVYDGYPLLFTHYSRIFPVKVALLALTELMRGQDRKLINFNKFTAKAYDLCEEISEKQRETKEKTKRESNISTGLPRPYSKNKSDPKQVEYQNRYKERYFGKVKRNKKNQRLYLEGLMSALNLIRVFKIDEEFHVTLTEKGKEFYMLKNPIFDRELVNTPFYDEERQYVLEKLLLGKQLEINLMHAAINIVNVYDNKMDKEKSITDYLDETFENTLLEYCNSNKKQIYSERIKEFLDTTEKIKKEAMAAKEAKKTESDATQIEMYKRIIKKQSPIEAIRIATMGRMSELGLVKWSIENGKSSYKLGEQELIKKLKNLNIQ